jgi:hypothetical protein
MAARLRRRHPEASVQIAVANFLRLALRPPTVWFAVDHGAGKMSRQAGGLLKARGGRRGLPDILVLHPNPAGSTAVVGIEIKAPTGRPSQAQADMEREFRRAHAAYEFCWSINDVEHALRTNGIPVHATVAGNGSLWPRRAA